MKRVLFVLTNTESIGPKARSTGYEFSEVAKPYLALREHGVEVEFASPLGGPVPEDGYDQADEDSRGFRESVAFAALKQSRRLQDVDSNDYSAIFFPGGLGPMVDLVSDVATKELIPQFAANGKVIAAVCHGPAALLHVMLPNGSLLLKNRRVSSFTRSEEVGHSLEDVPFLLDDALRSQGAIHTSVLPFGAHVEIDGNLITGQNPASARGVGLAIARALEAQ